MLVKSLYPIVSNFPSLLLFSKPEHLVAGPARGRWFRKGRRVSGAQLQKGLIGLLPSLLPGNKGTSKLSVSVAFPYCFEGLPENIAKTYRERWVFGVAEDSRERGRHGGLEKDTGRHLPICGDIHVFERILAAHRYVLRS